jgi:hypothetical protein
MTGADGLGVGDGLGVTLGDGVTEGVAIGAGSDERFTPHTTPAPTAITATATSDACQAERRA